MTDQRNIVWEPTERQSIFLSAPDDEVLYGGAAGGGKTDALVIDVLGEHQAAVSFPEYRGLLLRKTYAELQEVVDRMRALYPLLYPGVKCRDDIFWTFPSGARIELGYCDRDQDVYKYQSRQFQYIGWEELAQWATPFPYEYMISRLRAPDRLELQCYVRATCNPDGVGARWIAERWGIEPDGKSSYLALDFEGRKWRRRFIASRLNDNKHLSGTGYRERLLMLPEETRKALLDGRWDMPSVDGAIYGEHINKARVEQRITHVPHDPALRVDTAWDLGVGDSTSIWFTQSVGREIRVIDYYEASGEGLPHYAKVLDDKGYLYGRHIAPHDIAVREFSSGASRLSVAAGLGIKFEICANIAVEDGIHACRMIFPKLWIDAVKCKTGLEALTNYRRAYNKAMGEYKATPVHDWSSHGADAFRYFAVAHKDPGARVVTPQKQRYQTVGSGSTGWMAA